MVQNGGIEFTGMQLELGGQPTQFEYRPVGMELALCQRYYSIPLLNNEVDVYRHTGTSTGVPVFFKVSMRIAPTLALTLNSTVFGTINTGAGQGGLDGVSISTEGFALFVYTNSNPAQVGANVTAKATAELV
jgi:hypothetical protein